MGIPTGIGSFRQGLGNDILGGPGWSSPEGLGAALMQSLQPRTTPFGSAMSQNPGSTPISATAADGQVQTGTQAAVPSARLTDDNVDQLARVLTKECQGLCNADEIQGVGSTVINRMNRDGTDQVQDVIGTISTQWPRRRIPTW